MDNLLRDTKLKSDIIALKDYVAEQYGTELPPRIDDVLTEVNDLLFGIERGQLYMPYRELRLSSTWSAIDGAYDDDKKLERMIFNIQDDIYSIKRYIIVLAKYKLFSCKKVNDVNWLFPNLECITGKIQCLSYRDEDMLKISFPNGYEIDLGYIENEFIITVAKDHDRTNIIEEQRIQLRSAVEEPLQKLIYQYESL